MRAQVYFDHGQTEEKRRAFFEWNSLGLSYQLSLTCGINVNYYKIVHHPVPSSENKEHPSNFQNKQVSSVFNRVSKYILFLIKQKEK